MRQAVKKDQPSWQYEDAFARNLGLVSPAEQEILKNATVAIPGLGGVGGLHLITLARMGIGGFHIADRDDFDVVNTNRQYGSFSSTAGKSKTAVMEGFVSDVNPEVRLKSWDAFIDASNIDAFLEGVDAVVDSLDAWALDARILLYSKAREKGIPVVSAGPIGFSSAMFVVTKDSMSFWDYMDFGSCRSEEDRILKFILGLTPRPYQLRYIDRDYVDLKAQKGPSMSSSVTLCAGFAATEILKLLLKRGRVKALPHYHYNDPYLYKYKLNHLFRGNRNPIQKLMFYLVKRFGNL